MQQSQSRLQYSVAIIGIAANLGILLAIVGVESVPHWYPPIFFASAGYCLASQLASLVLRRHTHRTGQEHLAWQHALSSSRIGFLALIGIAVVVAAVLVFALLRH